MLKKIEYRLGEIVGWIFAILFIIGMIAAMALIAMTLCQDIYYLVNDPWLYEEEIKSLLTMQIGAGIELGFVSIIGFFGYFLEKNGLI